MLYRLDVCVAMRLNVYNMRSFSK